MLIYRLEHRSSGLGPFEHRSSRLKHPPQDALKGIMSCSRTRCGSFVMADISEYPEVKALLKLHPKAVFGWTSLEKYRAFITDANLLQRLGFRSRTYEVDPLYVSGCEQALFLRPSIKGWP